MRAWERLNHKVLLAFTLLFSCGFMAQDSYNYIHLSSDTSISLLPPFMHSSWQGNHTRDVVAAQCGLYNLGTRILIVKGYSCKLAALSDVADYFVATVDGVMLNKDHGNHPNETSRYEFTFANWKLRFLSTVDGLVTVKSYEIFTIKLNFGRISFYLTHFYIIIELMACNGIYRADYNSRYRMGPRTVGNVCRSELQVKDTTVLKKVDMMKEQFSKLLLGEDMSGEGKESVQPKQSETQSQMYL
ncbi:pollen-specific kinase partner protein, partial [Tanacetum coccineum]